MDFTATYCHTSLFEEKTVSGVGLSHTKPALQPPLPSPEEPPPDDIEADGDGAGSSTPGTAAAPSSGSGLSTLPARIKEMKTQCLYASCSSLQILFFYTVSTTCYTLTDLALRMPTSQYIPMIIIYIAFSIYQYIYITVFVLVILHSPLFSHKYLYVSLTDWLDRLLCVSTILEDNGYISYPRHISKLTIRKHNFHDIYIYVLQSHSKCLFSWYLLSTSPVCKFKIVWCFEIKTYMKFMASHDIFVVFVL